MPDETCLDPERRLVCVRGHLAATVRMIEYGADDLAVVHQLQAIRGALTQIQVQLLRRWLAEQVEWRQQPDQIRPVERDLQKILKRRR